MIIDKILNNNVAITIENHKEKIVMGKGICFKKKAGDSLDSSLVDKEFYLKDQTTLNHFKELIVDIPPLYLNLGEDILNEARIRLGRKLNDAIYIALVDHIYSSCLRAKDSIYVKNAMLWDIKRFYKDEYQIGLIALNMIQERTGIELPEDEAGFISLHIVNSESEDTIHDMYEITKVMQEISMIVKYHFKIDFNEESVYYYRFISHLRFFAQRLVEDTHQKTMDDDLLDVVMIKYRNAYHCVERIKDFVLQQYHYAMTSDEILYLTIHIHRVVYLGNMESIEREGH